MLACASLLVYGFGFIVVVVAIMMILEGFERRESSCVRGEGSGRDS